MSNLVIVESPTKARTLQKFLGDKYQIEASMGHVRDLPKSDFGVDIEHNFEPKYVTPKDKQKKVNELKKIAADSDVLWLATDPDREGEAIAWHIAHLLNKKDIHRVVFHEITESAIKEAFNTPRNIDLKLVDAQQARRILDRLVGYKLSPLLWIKVKKGLSAGRVQSVALRLIVEREREVIAFKADEYWTIEVSLNPEGKAKDLFIAQVIEKDGKKIEIKSGVEADFHKQSLANANYKVSSVAKKEVRRFPYPPFTTSTLQQAGANRLGFSAKKTMMIAQALYEHGLITYMRTDSFNLSQTAIEAARSYISDYIGRSYLPSSPRVYKSKSKNAQEAHEAIRPTNIKIQSQEITQIEGLNRDHSRLYDLIWKRFLACQMSEAVMDQTTVDIAAGSSYILRSTGSIIKFEGWMKLFGKETEENEEEAKQGENNNLPDLQQGEVLDLVEVKPNQHFTEPPPRYNEASLIKKLEELGIGRPSTYAPIISTIQERFYVEKEERKFTPTLLGMAVADFLITYFPDVFDYNFTAGMEDKLDEVARGEREWRSIMKDFYTPFEKKLEETFKVAEKVKMEVEKVDKKCPECGKDLVVRIGKFGKFLACSGFPECKHTESLEEIVNVKCPLDGGDVVVRKTKRGKTFYGCKNWPTCKFASWTKPKEEKAAEQK